MSINKEEWDAPPPSPPPVPFSRLPLREKICRFLINNYPFAYDSWEIYCVAKTGRPDPLSIISLIPLFSQIKTFNEIEKELEKLEKEGKIESKEKRRKTYYRWKGETLVPIP